MKQNRNDEVYSFLPPIDPLLGKRGIQNGHWIGIVGEPGSFKTVFTKWCVKRWLAYSNQTVVIYISTEENNRNVKRGLEDFGIDINKYKNEKRLKIGSVFCYKDDENEEGVQNNPNGVTQFAMKSIMDFIKHFKSLSNIRIMLIIDSMSSFWAHAPAMSRSIWTSIYNSLFHKIDIAFVTFQLAGTTHKAFGWGAEHGADGIFRLGKYIENGETHRYFIIDKIRNDKENGKLFRSKIENNEFILDGIVPSKGRYASSSEAIIGLKYENDQNIQMERNQKIEKIYLSLKRIPVYLSQLSKKLTTTNNSKI